jgi:hypothetical protein
MQRKDESNVECRHVVLEGWFMKYVRKRGFRGLSVVVGIFAAPAATAHPLTLSATIAISTLASGEGQPDRR